MDSDDEYELCGSEDSGHEWESPEEEEESGEEMELQVTEYCSPHVNRAQDEGDDIGIHMEDAPNSSSTGRLAEEYWFQVTGAAPATGPRCSPPRRSSRTWWRPSRR